jgi:autotransporter-associated beta strand protein
MARQHLNYSLAGRTLLVLALCCTARFAQAATSTFVQYDFLQGDAPWNDANSWADGEIGPSPPTTGGGHIPNAPGDVAILQQRITTDPTITSGNLRIYLHEDTTIGSLINKNTNNLFGSVIVGETGAEQLIFDNGTDPAVWTETYGSADDEGNLSRMRLNVPVTLNSDLIVNQHHNPYRNTSTEIVNQLNGGADITLTKNGLGSLQMAWGFPLGPSEGFLGDVIINEGHIRLINGAGTSNTTLSKSSGVTVIDGAQFQLGNGLSTMSLGAGAELKLNGAGNASSAARYPEGALRFEQTGGFGIVCPFNNPVNLQTTSRIFVRQSDVTGVLTDEVLGAGGLNKDGAGVLKLTAAAAANGNTYSGGTTVSGGTLVVNNTVGSGVGTGDVAVNNTGTSGIGATSAIGGTGFIGTPLDASNVTLTGSQMYPGDLTGNDFSPPYLDTSPGRLTVYGDVTFDIASSLNIDLNGATAGTNYDQLAASGTLSLGDAKLNIALGGGFTPSGQSFTLIDNQGAGAINGMFAMLNGVATDEITLGGIPYQLKYNGGNGNDLVLAPVNATLTGDYNEDGVVDAADYVLWRSNPSSYGGDPQGYNDWVANFGATSGSGSAPLAAATAVPEPTTTLLAGFALCGLLVVARKGRLRFE